MDIKTERIVRKYTKRWIIEKVIHEQLEFFHLNNVSSSMAIKVDVLVSWNFKHIVNLVRIRKYNAVNLMNGYSMLEIRNPREVLK